MNFRELKKEFRKIAVREFTDMDDFEQEELNAFLYYYNKCRTEEAIMSVLDDWCLTSHICELHLLNNKKYQIDFYTNEVNDLKEEYKYKLLEEGHTIKKIDEILFWFDPECKYGRTNDNDYDEAKIQMLKHQLHGLFSKLHKYY